MERNEIRPEHFQRWVDWARQLGIGLDFNPTCFSHPLSDEGMTLAQPDPAVRRFWIEHCQAGRRVSAHFGAPLGTASIIGHLGARRQQGPALRPARRRGGG